MTTHRRFLSGSLMAVAIFVRKPTLLVIMDSLFRTGPEARGWDRRCQRSLPLLFSAFIMGTDLRAEIRDFGPLDSTWIKPADGESRLIGVRSSYSRAKWNYSKITINNSMLRGKFGHGCVLFVQHPLEKGRSKPAPSGSFVACAGVLGNCDDATEGGIPRSSR